MNQLRVGTLLSYVKMFVNVAVGLVYVPIVLNYLSVEQYGLYQLVASLVAYLAILDFGLSGTITRFYSQKIALKDEDGKESVIAVSLIIYTVISALVVLIGIVFYHLMGTVYGGKLSTNEISSAKQMLTLLVVDVALMIPSHVFTAVITSHERFVFLRLSSIARSLLQPFLVVFLLKRNPVALSVVVIQLILDVLIIVITIGYAFQRLKIRVRLHRLDRALAKSMVLFSFFVFVNIIVDQVYWGTGQLILGAVVGTSAVAIYSIAIQFSNYLRQFSTAIISVLLPKVTKISSQSSDMHALNKLFIKVGRVQFLVLGLIISGFIVFGRSFIRLWVGSEFNNAYLMALIIMIPYTLDLTTSMGNLVLQAKNLHSRRSIVLSISALLNVILAIPLAKLYGGMGCAIAIGASLLLGNGITMLILYAKLGIQISNLLRNLIPLSISICVVTISGFFFKSMYPIDSWMILTFSISGFIAIFCLVVFGFGLNDEEKHTILKLLRIKLVKR